MADPTVYAFVVDGAVYSMAPLPFPDLPLEEQMPAEMAAKMVALDADQAGTVQVGWLYDGEAFAAPPVVLPPLPDRINAAFSGRVAAGLPLRDGRAVQLDAESRANLAAAALLADRDVIPEGFGWRLADNSTLPLTGPQVGALATAAGLHYAALFMTRSALLDAAAAGADLDPEAGWPDPVPFEPA